MFDLYLGPIRGSQSSKLGINEAPVDPKQTKLRCINCFNIFTMKTSSVVIQERPLILRPKWVCLCMEIAKSPDPCTACPICSRDDSFTRRRVHLCNGMTAARILTPTLLPARMMLDYHRCEPGCRFCGFKLDHIVCECP